MDPRRGSTSSSAGSNSSPERLPSFSEVAKGVPTVYTQWRTDPNTVGFAAQPFPSNYGHGVLLSPVLSPTCSSSSTLCFPDTEHNVPWSRAPIPGCPIPSELVTHFLHNRATQRALLSGCGPRARHIRQGKISSPEKHRHNDSRAKKAKRGNKPAKSCVVASASASSNKKRVNQQYRAIQQAFIIYHKVDLGLQWAEIRDKYIKWFPNDPKRSEGGVQCIFYRTNGNIPRQTHDKLLFLRYDYEVEDMDESEYDMCEEEDEVRDNEMPYNIHGCGNVPTVEYKTAHIKCREQNISLLERFPEVLADEENEWVKPEDRAMAKELVERRLQQSREWREWMRKTDPKRLYFVDNRRPRVLSTRGKRRHARNTRS